MFVTRPNRKIAIVGSSSSSRHLAPYDDPSWEIWTLAWNVLNDEIRRCSAAFEMHPMESWADYRHVDPAEYRRWIEDPRDNTGLPCRLYLRPREAGMIEKGIAFPIDEAAAMMGGRMYFTSSFSYMLSLAILENVSEIGVWGVDLLAGSEYVDQRPNAEFLLGVAHGKGIAISIAEGSALLRSGFRYGWDDDAHHPALAIFRERAQKFRDRIERLELEVSVLKGAMSEAEESAKLLEATHRGLFGKG